MKMEQESSALVLKSLKLIDDTKKAATQMKIDKANFFMLAYCVTELRPLLDDLNRQQEFLAANSSWPAMQRLTNVIESLNIFTKTCVARSRIYMLCHNADVVKEMTTFFKQLAESVISILETFQVSSTCKDGLFEIVEKFRSPAFSQEPGFVELARDIESSLLQNKFNEHAATELLHRIAKQLSVPVLDAGELLLELKRDLKTAESEGDEADIAELQQLCALLTPAEVLDDKLKLVLGDSDLYGSNDIPQSFFCPITREIMREPVMVEQGHSYERLAILEWFQRGHRTCPDTGQELQSLELIPNVKLQQAINEYFSSMHKGQLINALRGLTASSSGSELESQINTIKSILDSDPEYKRLLVSFKGLQPLITVLKPSSAPIREKILRILYHVALLGDDYKLFILEAEAIPVLLRLLQKNPGENGGPVQLLWELSKFEAGARAILSEKGSILIIATAFNLCQNDQKLLAEKLLHNLCVYDESVIVEAAKSSIFGPLIIALTSGKEATRLKMATAICESLELNDHSSSALVRAGVVPPLLDLLQHGSHESKQAAAAALLLLSSTDANKTEIAKAGSISILLKLLDTPLPQLKVDIMGTLSNLASDFQNAAEIDQEGAITQRLGMLLSQDTEMQEYSLRTLQCMAKDSHTVRVSVVDLRLVPSIYTLLRKEGLSSSCKRSVLQILCYLAEDRQTCQALVTSADTVKFLITIIEESSVEEDRQVVLSILAGFSKLNEMKGALIAQSQLLSICLYYVRAKGEQKLQESAAVILSGLCDSALMDLNIQMNLSRQGLISALTEVLSSSSSTDRAKQHAAVTLGLFSKHTPSLTERQSFFKQLLARLGFKKYKTCRVHAGKCNVRGTFCIVEAMAVAPLINLVKEGGIQTAEGALEALNTLVSNKENMVQGIDLLVKAGIISTLLSIVGKSTSLTEKAASMLEIIFKVKTYRDNRYSRSAKANLATILATGSADARKSAARALMHLKEMPRDSVYTNTSVS